MYQACDIKKAVQVTVIRNEELLPTNPIYKVTIRDVRNVRLAQRRSFADIALKVFSQEIAHDPPIVNRDDKADMTAKLPTRPSLALSHPRMVHNNDIPKHIRPT